MSESSFPPEGQDRLEGLYFLWRCSQSPEEPSRSSPLASLTAKSHPPPPPHFRLIKRIGAPYFRIAPSPLMRFSRKFSSTAISLILINGPRTGKGPSAGAVSRAHRGVRVARYFLLSEKRLADLYFRAATNGTTPNQAAPSPQGMSVEWVGRDSASTLSSEWAAHCREVSG